LADTSNLQWAGYLSTVGVYGDHDGAWVDEETPVDPQSKRSRMRVDAENAWLHRQAVVGFELGIFRLAGIYGPGRSALDKVRDGTARRIIKPGQVFNRIHVDDIGRVVAAAATRGAGGVFNVSDDEPGPPQDVIAHAADLLGVDAPPEVLFEEADLSPMGRSFYGENKRVSNARIKQAFGPMLYPTYREGLAALSVLSVTWSEARDPGSEASGLVQIPARTRAFARDDRNHHSSTFCISTRSSQRSNLRPTCFRCPTCS
jgi:nucleoside-diphosphate-sugar epimerase